MVSDSTRSISHYINLIIGHPFQSSHFIYLPLRLLISISSGGKETVAFPADSLFNFVEIARRLKTLVLEQINRQLESVVTIFKRDVSKRVGAFLSDEGERFDRVNPYTHPFCLNVQRLNRLMPTFRRLRFRLPFR